jgi:rod shape-determining protein MreC
LRLRVASLLVVMIVIVTGILSTSVPQLRLMQDVVSRLFTPVQWAISGPANGVGGFIDTVRTAGELRDENVRLRDEIGKLKQDAAKITELERDNQQLREDTGLKAAFPDFQFIEAAVVATDPSNLAQAVTINRGSDEGIKVGMTVITPAGLVGKIIKVSPGAAKVLLVTDSSNSVTALVQESRANGVVNGERTQKLRMRYLDQAVTINLGDKVITSGIGGVYPPGILIGEVSEVNKKDTDIFQEAVISPAVELGSLEKMLVIINHVPVKLDTE